MLIMKRKRGKKRKQEWEYAGYSLHWEYYDLPLLEWPLKREDIDKWVAQALLRYPDFRLKFKVRSCSERGVQVCFYFQLTPTSPQVESEIEDECYHPSFYQYLDTGPPYGCEDYEPFGRVWHSLEEFTSEDELNPLESLFQEVPHQESAFHISDWE